MADRRSLEDIFASAKTSAWSGRAFRVMLNDYPPDRENTQGARWNPPDTPAIYTCLEPAVCIAEVEYGLARPPRPLRPDLRKFLYELDVSLSAVIDLRPFLDELAGIGIGKPQLFADNMVISQQIGHLATWFGSDGLLVPSARHAGTNLVIYPNRANEAYRFEIIDQRPLSGTA